MTPDDEQRISPKHVEVHSKNKFEKLVHLVGYIFKNLLRSVCQPITYSLLINVPTGLYSVHPQYTVFGVVFGSIRLKKRPGIKSQTTPFETGNEQCTIQTDLSLVLRFSPVSATPPPLRIHQPYNIIELASLKTHCTHLPAPSSRDYLSSS
jgi:hypothetical protein